MQINTTTKFWPYLLAICLLAGVSYGLYRLGYSHGSTAVQLKWEQQKVTLQDAQNECINELAKQEANHQAKQQENIDALENARQTSLVAIARIRTDYDQRLLQSARRANVYRQQAETNANSCRDLAGHAARLDRTLEEGRALVGELSETLRLRDHQLKLLGSQLLNDRQFFEGVP